MKNIRWIQMILIGSLSIVVGCAEFIPPASQEIHSSPMISSPPREIKDLAGSWEYKDAAGEGIIMLDAKGHGAYEWEEGRLQTLSLKNGVWTGVWIQEGNDREGGFELTFSKDALVAEGKWWYTRIGKDTDPLEPGGPFKMIRSPTIKIAQ